MCILPIYVGNPPHFRCFLMHDFVAYKKKKKRHLKERPQKRSHKNLVPSFIHFCMTFMLSFALSVFFIKDQIIEECENIGGWILRKC